MSRFWGRFHRPIRDVFSVLSDVDGEAALKHRAPGGANRTWRRVGGPSVPGPAPSGSLRTIGIQEDDGVQPLTLAPRERLPTCRGSVEGYGAADSRARVSSESRPFFGERCCSARSGRVPPMSVLCSISGAIRDWDLNEDPPLLLGNGDILEEVEIVEATTAAHHHRGEWILCQHDRQSRLLA